MESSMTVSQGEQLSLRFDASQFGCEHQPEEAAAPLAPGHNVLSLWAHKQKLSRKAPMIDDRERSLIEKALASVRFF
jgi:hypothetical protein